MTQKIYRKFRRFIEGQNLFLPDSRLLVAVSGGQDSVALVHLLLELKKEWSSLEIALAHFNHHLRAPADEDEKFVRKMAAELKLEIYVGRGRVREMATRHGLNLEEAARLKRYEFLEKTALKWGADFILTGHTMTDQAETVLMKIFRGTGIEGLQGIRVKKGQVVRPLLCLTRRETEEYLKEKGIAYRVDETNLDTGLLRNRIRLELIPLLEKEYDPQVVSHLARLAQIAQSENDALEELAEGLWPLVSKNAGFKTGRPDFPECREEDEKAEPEKSKEKEGKAEVLTDFLLSGNELGIRQSEAGAGSEGHEKSTDAVGARRKNSEEKYPGEIPEPFGLDYADREDKSSKAVGLAPELELNLRAINSLPEAVARRLIRKFLRLSLGLESPTFEQTEAVRELKEGQKFSWGKDKVLMNEAGWLKKIKAEHQPKEFSVNWDGKKELYLGPNLIFSGRFIERKEVVQPAFDDETACYLDAGRLKFPLEVRSRKPGDRYRPLGLKGQKKLKELFQERKIPVGERQERPVFLSAGKIIWVPGLPVAEEFKVTKNTRIIFLIEKLSLS